MDEVDKARLGRFITFVGIVFKRGGGQGKLGIVTLLRPLVVVVVGMTSG